MDQAPQDNKDGLNPHQYAAIEHEEGPLLVLAGAGSGKTRVVTMRIARLIEKGVSSEKILGLTFTNKAAGEMQERVHTLCQQTVLIATFHSLGARILRESITHLGYETSFTIYDEDDIEKVMKSCLVELGMGEGSKEDKLDVRTFRTLVSRAKNAMLSPGQICLMDAEEPSEAERRLPQVYMLYQKKLKTFNALDFDDLLYLTVRLFQEHPEVLQYYQQRWNYLLIDEYQDTNQCQYQLVQHLVARHHNLFVVGDPDQSIYSWRGANMQNILDFEKDYPKAHVVRLEQNYRSTTTILDASNALITKNEQRYKKELWSLLGKGELIKLHKASDDRQEAQFVIKNIVKHRAQGVALHDMVIFYRTNFQSRVFEDALLGARIPYAMVGGLSFYQRKEIKDLIAYLRVVQSNHDVLSFERSLHMPKRGIGAASFERLRYGASISEVPIFTHCQQLMELSEWPSDLRFTAKQKGALKGYIALIQHLKDLISEKVELRKVVEVLVKECGILDALKEEPDGEERLQNVREFLSTTRDWSTQHPEGTLDSFLEELSLKSSLDQVDESSSQVQLMTVHSGKGLEFPVAFLVGMEEELFPHANSRSSETAVEEERRLCYVGMTRAKQILYLTHSVSRMLWGTIRGMRPSRFLKEIPEKFIEKVQR